MKTHNIKIIEKTFKEISDIVTGTMGAKGELVVLPDEFSRPYLTDDGVTVARECLKQENPFAGMVAKSMIEAANNTEKVAYDGTTLTVLLTYEFYKAGLKLIKKGVHPQNAAAIIEREIEHIRRELDTRRILINENNKKLVRDVANITTKIPMIGELVYEAYLQAGDQMNIIIEHDRAGSESSIEHVDGMVIDAGYFSPELKQLCGADGRFVAEDAMCFLLGEGVLTPVAIRNMFESIPDMKKPIVFFVDKGFNPEVLNKILTTCVENKMVFMFVFINESNSDEIFLDIAAKTNGTVQSSAFGTTDYLSDYAGIADKIIVEQDKTTIISRGDPEKIQLRLNAYKEELEKNRYTTGLVRADAINRRMSNLDKGLTKIKLALSTITEFQTMRFKLDDAIGAVRCACQNGVLLGSGKELFRIGEDVRVLRKALQAPMRTIIRNAGLKLPPKRVCLSDTIGLDVKTNEIVDLKQRGIIDSYTSVVSAVSNAGSIATSYLKAYVLINNN